MKGFCFLGPPEGKDAKRHLKIILTEPNAAGFVAVATVTTLRKYDPQSSYILRKGDHPFIKHDSVVNFKRAVVKRAVDIISGQFSGELVPKEELDPAVFERVLKAAKSAKRIHERVKALLQDGG